MFTTISPFLNVTLPKPMHSAMVVIQSTTQVQEPQQANVVSNPKRGEPS
jgi:hypothetical protein